MRGLALIATTLLVAGCTQSPAQTARAEAAQQATVDALQRRLAGLTPGQPQSCLPTTLSSAGISTKGYGSTILYIAGSGLIYRNDTTGGCENIARGDALVTRQLQGRACSGDIVTTVDQTSRTVTGSCALRDFVPYRRVQ